MDNQAIQNTVFDQLQRFDTVSSRIHHCDLLNRILYEDCWADLHKGEPCNKATAKYFRSLSTQLVDKTIENKLV